MNELTTILLSPERTTAERLDALASLQPFLKNGEAVAWLCTAAREETALEVRTAMLELLCTADITYIQDREEYIATLAHFAGREPERALRRIAVEKLAAGAMHEERMQEILAETLAQELDPFIQQQCIAGLARCARKTPFTTRLLNAYVPAAPAVCRPALLQLVQQLEPADAQRMSLYFLEHWESLALQQEAVRLLGVFPSLLPEVVAQLLQQLSSTPYATVRTAIAGLLGNLKEVDTAVFRLMLDALSRMPDLPELLSAITGRLTAHPELVAEVADLFRQTPSAYLKMQLLMLLRNSHAVELVTTALQDPHPGVRQLAAGLAGELFPQHPETMEPALIAAVGREPITALRARLLYILLNTGRKSAEAAQFLIAQAVQENDPLMEVMLAAAVLDLPLAGKEQQDALLPLYQRVLTGPFFPGALKQQVSERIQAYAYQDQPALKDCLYALLENATDINQVRLIYDRLKTLETDPARMAPVLIKTLYRHIAWYPQAPLHEWMQLFGKLAPAHEQVRSQLPHLIAITGATWLLTETDKADQTGAFLPAFRRALQQKNSATASIEVSRLLREAWQNRTLKKAEVIALYNLLLRLPKSDGLLQQLLDIMEAGKLATPELVQASLDFLTGAPDPNNAYSVRKYLENTGYLDLEYRQRLAAMFTQEQYLRYCRLNAPSTPGQRPPASLQEWENGGWQRPYPDWPIATLLFALEPGDMLLQLFTGADTAALQLQYPGNTLQYLVLDHLWRNPYGKWAQYTGHSAAFMEQWLDTLYALYRQLPADNPTADRILVTCWKKWPDYKRLLNGRPVPEHLSKAAAHLYLDVNRRLQRFDPELRSKQLPAPLDGMDLQQVQQEWIWGPALWETFEIRYYPRPDPDQQAAEKLFQQAAADLQAGRIDAGYQALQDLLKHYSHTKLVGERRYNIETVLRKIDQDQGK